MSKVCVLGSLNMDMVINVAKMPSVGETVFGEDISNAAGGKGANQAVAAKRAGAEVYMIGKVGKDNNGKLLSSYLVNDGINTDYIFKDEKAPTGTAIITVNKEGNNSIIVVAGANMTISQEEIEKAQEIIKSSDLLVSQFETPIDISIMAFRYAKENGCITILNPAPAKAIPEELLKYTDIIVPNETEAFELTGIKVEDLESAKKASKSFLDKGVKFVIITLGEKGAALVSGEKSEIVQAYKVEAIDTTAAGDSFIGGLATKLDKNTVTFEKLQDAVKFGNMVSSIVVQRKGAQPSIPYLKEIKEVYGDV